VIEIEYNKEEVREKYKALFEHSLDLIYVNDLNGNFLDASDLTLIALGIDREDIPNISFIDLLDRDNLIKAYKVTKEIRKTGKQSAQSEYKLKTKMGDYIYIETYGIPLKKDGEIYAILGVAKNITERKKAEKNLKESADMFKALFKEGSIPAYTWKNVDGDFVLIDYNNAAAKITQGSVENFLGNKASEMYKDRLDILNDLHLCLKDKTHIRREINYRFQYSNEEKYLLVNYSYVDPDLIVVRTEDITERKKAEEKLKESERKYHNLYDNTPFSVVLINTQGVVVDMNPKVKEMFGYAPEELLDRKFMDLSIIHPDYLSTILALFKKFIKGERMHRMDVQIQKKDGKIVWTNLQAALMKIGDETFVQALFTDITAQKEVEFLIDEEVKKLKELDKIRKNLISRVSHELKTPLVSVTGGCELLLTIYGEKLNEEELEIIALIEKGGKRLKHLVDNLIDISLFEYEKFKLVKEPNDLSAIIREIANELMYSIRERNINLNLVLPESFYIKLDKVRIEQVLMNLLSNAIKNTPPNGEICVNLKKKENSAEFSIKDTGIGISQEEMNMLFTRFGKLERYGEGYEYIDIQGTGLGLYISKEIIDSHEGEIRAESGGRNKGSTFIVKLPIS